MNERDIAQSGNRTFKLTGMTQAQVLDLMKEIGKAVANELMKREIPVPSKRRRPDVGHCQIDMIVIREKASTPEPAIQIGFEVQGNMGISLKIKLLEYLEDPHAYMADIFRQMAPMRRNVERRRAHTRAMNDHFYKALTEGPRHG